MSLEGKNQNSKILWILVIFVLGLILSYYILQGATERTPSKHEQAEFGLTVVSELAKEFYSKHKRLPTPDEIYSQFIETGVNSGRSSFDMIDHGLMRIVDPWGKPITISGTTQMYDIISSGRDGIFNSADDIKYRDSFTDSGDSN